MGSSNQVLELLREQARRMAETDFVNATTSVNKNLRNKSAYVSRQAQRHYASLLETFLNKAEQDRDRFKHFITLCKADCANLQLIASNLTRIANSVGPPKSPGTAMFEKQLRDLNTLLQNDSVVADDSKANRDTRLF